MTLWVVKQLLLFDTFHEIAASKFENPNRRYNQDEKRKQAANSPGNSR
jgi:hypothetical protein